MAPPPQHTKGSGWVVAGVVAWFVGRKFKPGGFVCIVQHNMVGDIFFFWLKGILVSKARFGNF